MLLSEKYEIDRNVRNIYTWEKVKVTKFKPKHHAKVKWRYTCTHS
jgi:hypothetical protein